MIWRLIRTLSLAAFALGVLHLWAAQAQVSGGSVVSQLYCYVSGAVTSPTSWAACSSSNPLSVTIAGSGGGALLTKSGTYASSGTDQFALAVGTNTQLTVPATTTCAQITLEGANIRRTSDTTSATTTNGTLIQVGASWQDCGPLAAYKFTAVSGSPTLDVEYFK